MELTLIIIISLFISLAWIYYFKMIDLFEREKTYHILITFILGTVIPFIIYPLHDYVFDPLGISDSDNPLYSFLYFTFAVGLVEEFIKCLPLLIVLFVFRKAVNEPLDYVKYICVSALGFAFGENVEYALYYGHHVLLSRAILSVPGHMFFSALFVYGYVEYRYHQKQIIHVFKYILIAAVAHGIYDFLLGFEIRILGVFLNILFFFLVISAFVTILNNNINASPFYTPKKAIDQEKVRKTLIWFYVPILLTTIIVTAIFKNGQTAIGAYYRLMFWNASILYVLIVRLSRFSIVPNLKNNVKLEFPFYYKREIDRNDFNFFFGLLTVRGESHNEARLAALYEEKIKIVPLSSRKSYLNGSYDGIIEQKIYNNGITMFVLKLFLDSSNNNFKHYLLKPKTNGISHTADNSPIVSLNSVDSNNNNRIVFLEWVVLKPVK